MSKPLNDTLVPRKEKPPSTPRGGFIVCRRHASKSTLRASPTPFEHSSLKEARKQAEALSRERGAEFCVYREVAAYRPVRYPLRVLKSTLHVRVVRARPW